jgi:hypothetical protein
MAWELASVSELVWVLEWAWGLALESASAWELASVSELVLASETGLG